MGSKQTQLAMQHLLCNRLYENVARDTWPLITEMPMSGYVENSWGTCR